MQNSETISKCAELAGRTANPRAIWCLDLGNRHSQLKRMDGQFRFSFETTRERGERFNEPPRKDSISRQHVANLSSENFGYQAGQQSVAKHISPPESRLCRGHPGGVDHVEGIFKQALDHSFSTWRIISAVAVH